MGLEWFDHRNPDYSRVFAERAERLQWIRDDPTGQRLIGVSAWYATDEGVVDFISDWGMTFDPRLADANLPTTIPFVLFPRQRDWLLWVLERWRAKEPGISEKSRDWGLTWLAIALSCTLCLFRQGVQIGFGSRKEEYVDSTKSPKAIFHKGRQFIELLPPEFRGGWQRKANAAHMRIDFPNTGSVITGEAGDNIGRGDRATLYFVDESAFIERPQLVEASLSQTTNCRIDISTPHGMTNPFAEKRHNKDWERLGRIFTASWQDDPRKDAEWYERQRFNLDPVTLAQEVDLSYTASVANIVIPQEWVQAAIDLDAVLGFEARGDLRAAFDVGDEGDDCALAVARGIRVASVQAWSGKGADIFDSVEKAFLFCDLAGVEEMDYDADGLGAGVRGDARIINEQRTHKIEVRPFWGSGKIVNPDDPIPTAAPRAQRAKDAGEVTRLNGDYFENAKAQGWFNLRVMFQRAYRARKMASEGRDWREAYDEDDLIVLAGDMEAIGKLSTQLSQATFGQSKSGKMLIVKAPEGTKSPNHADTVMMRYAPREVKAVPWIMTRD